MQHIITDLETSLADDEELAVYYAFGAEQIRITSIYRTPQTVLVVLAGYDQESNQAIVLVHLDSTSLLCCRI